MAIPSKRLFVVLSLCLLLQQFAPTYAANLSHTKDKHSKKSHKAKHHDIDEELGNYDQTAEIRSGAGKILGSILRKGWKLLGDGDLIEKLNLGAQITGQFAKAVTFGVQMEKIINECNRIAPDLASNWAKYKELNEEFRNISDSIDRINLQAQSRQLYTNTTFYEYGRTIKKLENTADIQERIIEYYGEGNSPTNLSPDETKTKRASVNVGNKLAVQKFKISQIDFALQLLGDFVGPKLVQGGKGFQSAGTRFEPIANIGASVYDIWSLVVEIEECKEKGAKAQEAVTKTQEGITKAKEIEQNVTDVNKEIQSAYDDVNQQVFNQTLLDQMSKLTEMMKDPEMAKQTDEVAGVVKAMENYQNGKDIETEIDIKKLDIDVLQREVNDALQRVTFTLDCHLIKARFVKHTRSDCSQGKNSLLAIYNTNKRIMSDAASGQCLARIGELFDSVDVVKASWEEWASKNTAVDPICLMNDKVVVKRVKEELQKGISDPQAIAQKIFKQDADDEIQAMIDKLKDDPFVKQLSQEMQNVICQMKTMGQKYEEALGTLEIIYPERKVTKEEYENQTCPVPAQN